MQKRFLIVVGLPKSGTTFLYAECAKRPDAFAMPLHVKEVDYFRRDRDRAAYLKLFDQAGDKVIVDSSPLYIDQIEQSVGNMAAALVEDDVRIVVCLRDPLERAYSHYLHDVAQHQKIVGHADYGFWSPTVMAKYIYPLVPRIRFLQETFGADRVLGFAFGADMTGFESKLRAFAQLPEDWHLDLSDNPAPGFTAPQAYFNADHDTEIPLDGGRHRLPKGQFLVVNRQYSILRPKMDRALAEQIVLRQSTLTRQFDTGTLEDRTRDRLYDDMAEAAAMLGVDMPLNRAARVFHAKPSDSVPPHILAQLPNLGPLDDAVVRMMAAGLAPTMRTVAGMPSAGPSLARDMARMQLAQMGASSEPASATTILSEIVHTFGPIPIYIESMMRRHVARREYDAALALFDRYGGPDRLLWPMDLAPFLKSRGLMLPEDVAKRFETAGVRVRLPA